MSSIADQIRQCESKIRELRNTSERVKFDLAVEEAVLSRLQAVGETLDSNNGGSVRVPGSLAGRIEEALIASAGPMTVNAITEALEKAGVSTESPDGLKPSVASALSRRKDLFVRVGKGEYDLVSRQKKLGPQEKEQEKK
jgi:hypothetical protein